MGTNWLAYLNTAYAKLVILGFSYPNAIGIARLILQNLPEHASLDEIVPTAYLNMSDVNSTVCRRSLFPGCLISKNQEAST
jgi:hypothetical protein